MHYIISLFILLVALGCQQVAKTTPDTESPPQTDIKTSMHKFSEVLSNIFPKLYADRAASTEGDRKSLRDAVSTLKNISHDIDQGGAMPSHNPKLQIISTQFKSDLGQVESLMREQKWPEAQERLTQVTRYCIACHTAGPGQSSPFALSLNPDLSGLTHYQRARYLAAVRRFDDAVAEFETALNDKDWSATHPKEWDYGLVSILSIVTHVRKDANLALEIISAFRDRKVFPARLEPASSIWRKQAKAWDKERKSSASLTDVEEWIRFGKTLRRPDYANTFLFVRASARLNELLTDGALKGDDEVKALYLNGVVGRELKAFNYFSFPEQSFALCARRSPQSDIGKKCAAELESYKKETGV